MTTWMSTSKWRRETWRGCDVRQAVPTAPAWYRSSPDADDQVLRQHRDAGGLTEPANFLDPGTPAERDFISLLLSSQRRATSADSL